VGCGTGRRQAFGPPALTVQHAGRDEDRQIEFDEATEAREEA